MLCQANWGDIAAQVDYFVMAATSPRLIAAAVTLLRREPDALTRRRWIGHIRGLPGAADDSVVAMLAVLDTGMSEEEKDGVS
jgi:hypothetical protein